MGNEEYSYQRCCKNYAKTSLPPLRQAVVTASRHGNLARAKFFLSVLSDLKLHGLWVEVGVKRGDFSFDMISAMDRNSTVAPCLQFFSCGYVEIRRNVQRRRRQCGQLRASWKH